MFSMGHSWMWNKSHRFGKRSISCVRLVTHQVKKSCMCPWSKERRIFCFPLIDLFDSVLTFFSKLHDKRPVILHVTHICIIIIFAQLVTHTQFKKFFLLSWNNVSILVLSHTYLPYRCPAPWASISVQAQRARGAVGACTWGSCWHEAGNMKHTHIETHTYARNLSRLVIFVTQKTRPALSAHRQQTLSRHICSKYNNKHAFQTCIHHLMKMRNDSSNKKELKPEWSKTLEFNKHNLMLFNKC